MKKENYIGVIDSGFGGISVLNKLIEIMPNENYIFFGDSINSPYGTKTKNEILRLTKNIINKILPFELKELVIACNTISCNVYDNLISSYPYLKIIPTTPNLNQIFFNPNKTLNESTLSIAIDKNFKLHINKQVKNTNILIIATNATCKSEFIKKEINKYKNFANIYVENASQLVTFIENMMIDSTYCDNYLYDLLKNYYDDIDYLVLGCTHFPFVIKNIKKQISENTIIIDNAFSVANNAFSYLKNNDLLNNTKLNINIVDTINTNDRKKMYSYLLSMPYDNINFIDINNL